MHSASIAEWIIARFTSAKRAASIVGDLLELKPQKGPLWFWLSAVRVVIALVWRRPLAFIAAFYVGAWALGGFQIAIAGVHMQHRPPQHLWMPVLTALSAAATILLFLLVYAAIRYGFRDRVTQIALALTGLATVVIYYWWQPAVLVACAALNSGVVVASILSSERRRAALVLLAVVVVGFGGGLLAMYLDTQYQHFVYPGLVGGRELREHPSLLWMDFCLLLLAAWMMTTACSRMHNWLMGNRNPLIDPETEPKSLS
jgi:hypothetical protein